VITNNSSVFATGVFEFQDIVITVSDITPILLAPTAIAVPDSSLNTSTLNSIIIWRSDTELKSALLTNISTYLPATNALSGTTNNIDAPLFFL